MKDYLGGCLLKSKRQTIHEVVDRAGVVVEPRLRSAYSTEPSPQRPAPPHRNRPNPHPNPILMLINGLHIRIIHATTVSSSAS
jgi:hypothetical protein